ncbi:MAG: hypothetical protein LW650_09140 [Planctomycetaceae bacterium]|jgi:hypothetical protein|nr:hypothetical protein [Phycisphaerales bacterium]MCE2653639.1 hypothetical protein [Planctomycetaceae bacterium]
MIKQTWYGPLTGAAMMLCAGGVVSADPVAECFTWSQVTETAATPSPRFAHVMAYHGARNAVVLFGGRNGVSAVFADTWEWSNGAWSVQSGPGPAARDEAAAAYDGTRGKLVMFGGQGLTGQRLSDTWEYGVGGWEQRSPATAPTARNGAAMAYDPVRNVTVLFGGATASGLFVGDTWEYDGTDWTLRMEVGPPDFVGAGTLMSFDPVAQKVVLFNSLGQTWTWDGTNWTLASFMGPSMGLRLTMTYDSARGRMVLFGSNRQGSARETWEWNGTTWTLRSSATGPQSRVYAGMAFDPAQNHQVYFGGRSFGSAAVWDQTWIGSAMSIVTQPAATLTVVAGQPVSLGVVVAGSGPLVYQWRKNGANLVDGAGVSGSQSASLSLPAAALADAGTYDVVVTGPCGTVQSTATMLAVESGACNVADVVGIGGELPADGLLTGDDFNAFIGSFAAGELLADIVGIGGEPPADGLITGDDFNAFIAAFAAGCP